MEINLEFFLSHFFHFGIQFQDPFLAFFQLIGSTYREPTCPKPVYDVAELEVKWLIFSFRQLFAILVLNDLPFYASKF